jgi:hypothetical protein
MAQGGYTFETFGHQCEVDPSIISAITGQRQITDKRRKNNQVYTKEYMGIDVADRIITNGLRNPFLWHSHFDDVYQQDFIPNEREKELLGIPRGRSRKSKS